MKLTNREASECSEQNPNCVKCQKKNGGHELQQSLNTFEVFLTITKPTNCALVAHGLCEPDYNIYTFDSLVLPIYSNHVGFIGVGWTAGYNFYWNQRNRGLQIENLTASTVNFIDHTK
uniref:Uncharacterized protein n=1 Tax=Glossina austeni TaxID=7395 RepID=A0A1A9UUJ7_GLOAU